MKFWEKVWNCWKSILRFFRAEKMDKHSDLTVYEFKITKKALMEIDERERAFFLLLGFVCNEIIILNKLALAIDVFNRKTDGVEKKAYVVQASFISRLLIAKMFEAWEKLFQKLYFKSAFSREYEEFLSPKANEALSDLGKFFAENGYVAALRNQFVFHYPSQELNDVMPGIPDHDDWKIYLSKTDGNSLYFLSEMVAGHAMLAEVNLDKALGYEKLIDDRNYLVRSIMALSTGCMNVFVKRHLELSMEDGTPITIKVPDLFDVKIPFFMGSATK